MSMIIRNIGAGTRARAAMVARIRNIGAGARARAAMVARHRRAKEASYKQAEKWRAYRLDMKGQEGRLKELTK
jgi:hypothetical protein